METAGVSEAIQVLNVIINGSATALKLTGQFAHFSGHEMKELGKFIMARHYEGKNKPETLSLGESGINEIFRVCQQNDETVGLMVIPQDMLNNFVEYANANHLSFAKMCPQEGKTDITILYPEHQKWAYQGYMMTNEKARATDFGEYLSNVTIQDRVNVDNQLARMKAYDHILSNQNMENKESISATSESVIIDKSQIVGIHGDSAEISVKSNDELGFVKIPYGSLKRVANTDSYVLNIADSSKALVSKTPSIVKDEDEKFTENIVSGSMISGVDIRVAATNRFNDIVKGKKINTTYVNPDVDITKTVDVAKKAGESLAEVGKTLSKSTR